MQQLLSFFTHNAYQIALSYIKSAPDIVAAATADLFFSSCPLCCSCSTKQFLLCTDCIRRLPWLLNACEICTRAQPTGHKRCGNCEINPPEFDRAIAAFTYAPPIDLLIRDLKYRQKLSRARILGELLAAFVQRCGVPSPDVIMPVPLHISKQQQRGFNQSYEIARIVGNHLRCPVDENYLIRVGSRRQQTRLSEKQRTRLPLKTFLLRRPPPNHVVILDDVLTTGTTVKVIARTLKRAGVQRVDVWVVAKTLSHL